MMGMIIKDEHEVCSSGMVKRGIAHGKRTRLVMLQDWRLGRETRPGTDKKSNMGCGDEVKWHGNIKLELGSGLVPIEGHEMNGAN